ncbi:MAG: FliM/FliN family flagellar motor switch protein [Candidatus Hydrogenedentes bacterium]|nr:FliM/FliN family flagellar motor switch protein [Candidatus Hydrogenedentota bacterium]
MNPAAANVLSEGFLKGAFDVFEAMLALACTPSAGVPEPLTAQSLDTAVAAYPVALIADIQGGLGSVGLLFPLADAAKLAAMDFSADTGGKTALDAGELATLSEIASSALGGGVTNLMERFGRNVEQLEHIEVLGSEAQKTLSARFGTDAIIVPFSFAAPPNISGKGVALFDGRMEVLVPEEVLSESGAAGKLTEATLSPQEMSDILSGFDTGTAAPGRAMAGNAPENLDMILDIRLVATARLGRVELPIGDILGLGPGSIIEVGHLVDEPIELLVNDKLIARGDVVVVDEKFGLRITEIVSQRERIESLQ